ncbi:MAG: hypothetical protein ACREEM_13180 [Blastocatellia bacterium]
MVKLVVTMPAASLLRDRLLAGVARGYQDKDLAALALVCAEESLMSRATPGKNEMGR